MINGWPTLHPIICNIAKNVNRYAFVVRMCKLAMTFIKKQLGPLPCVVVTLKL